MGTFDLQLLSTPNLATHLSYLPGILPLALPLSPVVSDSLTFHSPKGIWSFDLVSQLIASIDVLKCHRVHSIYQAYRHMSIFQTYKIFSNVKMDLI